MEQRLNEILQETCGKSIDAATDGELFTALLRFVKERLAALPVLRGGKKLYYISAEFLLGKLLSNDLIDLGLFDEARAVLAAHGHDLTEVEALEPEPSLGNGGLGRLAACFLDSIATLGLPGDGVGLNYHEGLFLQKFKDNKQREEKNPWIADQSFLTRTDTRFEVPFGGFTLTSTLYDIDVPGWKNGRNKLHLFDLDSVDESIVHDGIQFDKTDIRRNLTLFLYPDDSDENGRLLRIYQQYFMVSNAAQLILKEAEERGVDLYRLPDHVAIQINDTHPTLVIPELIRLLTERGFNLDTAVDVVTRTCSYTNHTILSEALEKWPAAYLEKVVPQLMPIIRELDARVRRQCRDPRVQIIDDGDLVHMAHIDIHFGHAVNGVAELHTQILERSELKPFYDLYPQKFSNKTNGITFRRWLVHCNHPLASYLEELLGPGYLDDAGELEKLLPYGDDPAVISRLREIKARGKGELCRYLKTTQGLELDPGSVMDIQAKRLHEYKRQQMNALYVIWKYKQIKAGVLPKRPVTVLFAAKAAPAYTIAKDVIHLILCLQRLIESDPQVRPWLRVVMVENYNVTSAEKLIPACDVSEQISLASKEASGTGNMKFMLSGAVTLGTEDGANVEIHRRVGDENIYIFGARSRQVIQLYETGGYHPADYYDTDPVIEDAVDFIISKQLIRIGDPVCLGRLYKELVSKDYFMTLLDLKEYIAAKERMLLDYEDETAWSKKMLVNIAKAGYFSSDRTIAEYDRDIWHLTPSV